uniref:Uncharacterized protein n=1 Tax=Aegilops tauschii subsp. strangulata TaxID=200361 RepID=A0A453ML03_AEGTS
LRRSRVCSLGRSRRRVARRLAGDGCFRTARI